MTKRKRATVELISSFVFLVAGLWLMREGQDLVAEGAVLKSIFVVLGGALSFAAAFRFQIQRLFDNKNE